MNAIKYIAAVMMLAVAVFCFAGGLFVPACMSIAAAALTLIPTFGREED